MSMSAIALMTALSLTAMANQAQGTPDTPPARYAYPAAVPGQNAVTKAETAVIRASRAGNTAAAMRGMGPILRDRVNLPERPATYTCVGGSSRFTCGMRAGNYNAVIRVMIAPDRPLVVTRTFVKWNGVSVASAWAAQARVSGAIRIFSPNVARASRGRAGEWVAAFRLPENVQAVNLTVSSYVAIYVPRRVRVFCQSTLVNPSALIGTCRARYGRGVVRHFPYTFRRGDRGYGQLVIPGYSTSAEVL